MGWMLFYQIATSQQSWRRTSAAISGDDSRVMSVHKSSSGPDEVKGIGRDIGLPWCSNSWIRGCSISMQAPDRWDSHEIPIFGSTSIPRPALKTRGWWSIESVYNAWCVWWVFRRSIQRKKLVGRAKAIKSTLTCLKTCRLIGLIKSGQPTSPIFRWPEDFFIWGPLSTGTAEKNSPGGSLTRWTSYFCIEALNEALQNYGTPEIFNTDQGAQFTSKEFTDIVKEQSITISMDGKRTLDG